MPRSPGPAFGGFAVGDRVTVSSERSPNDGRSGRVTGAHGGRVYVLIGDRTFSFYSHELVRG